MVGPEVHRRPVPAKQTLNVSAGARLDRLPFGLFHGRMLALIGAGTFLDGFDIFLSGAVLADRLNAGWSTLQQNAAFNAATFGGIMIGALLAGILGDRFGRRPCCRGNLLVFGVASLGAMIAPDMRTLSALRFIMGLGLGSESVVAYAILAELMPVKSRGRCMAALLLIVNFSAFAASIVGLWVIPTFGWRYMFAIVGVGALIVWFLRRSIPESPRWLESRGRHEDANEVLRAIELEFETLPSPTLVPERVGSAPRQVSILVLLRRDVLPRTMLGCLFSITYGVCIYGLLGWLPSFFVKQGLDVVRTLQFTTAMNLGAPFGSLLQLVVADRLGRRDSLIYGSIATAIMALIYSHVFEPAALIVVGFTLVTSIYFWLTAGFTMVAELFPTEFRIRGAGFCNAVGRAATILVQFAVVPLFGWGGVNAVVVPIVALLLVQISSFWFSRLETQRKPLL
jgi:MFS transporter, putative metabolite:H+ symporter